MDYLETLTLFTMLPSRLSLSKFIDSSWTEFTDSRNQSMFHFKVAIFIVWQQKKIFLKIYKHLSCNLIKVKNPG